MNPHSKKQAFVFVVCGAKEHIQTLNFSIKSLKKHTSFSIFVVTDSKRNEDIIQHEQIIDIATPVEYSNHVASIWLKTSLHKILPKGYLYCYLDSDVLALNNECNKIFEYYKPPITFAKDRTLKQFSPYAVNCNCLENFYKTKKIFNDKLVKVFSNKNFIIDFSNPLFRQYLKEIQTIRENKMYWLKFLFLYFFSYLKPVKITSSLLLDAKNKSWILLPNTIFPIIFLHKKQIQKFGFKYSFLKNDWYLLDKKSYLNKNECVHFSTAIKEKFSISINENFILWNGGVFLFDNNSNEFLELWHQNTFKILQDKYWKIRDQSGLLITIFQLGLENHKNLPVEFNFIADFYNTSIYPHPKIKDCFMYNNQVIKPNFIHVFHRFGDLQWDVWQRITEILDTST